MLLRRVARPLLSAVFIGQGIETLSDVKPAADVLRPTLEGLQALPAPVGTRVPTNALAIARITAVAQIGGGLLLATGRIPRLASAVLAATVIPANLGEHMFWAETDPVRKTQKRRAFLTDLSLVGGLVLASADTAGKPSLGWRGRRAGNRVVAAVTAALPSSEDSVLDSDFADKISHSLHAGVDRSRELASAAIEKGIPIAETAARRGAELAETAAHRGAELAETAAHRGADLAETARDQGSEHLTSGWRRLRNQISA